MPARKRIDPVQLRAAVTAVAQWLADPDAATPTRSEMAAAVRLGVRTLEDVAPGSAVEVRVPPFAAVQCIDGPRHTRGTPPNVVETDPRTWLLLATGLLTYDDAVAAGSVSASGSRAGDIAHWLPLLSLRD